jgi:hypothetical protein
MKALKVVGIAVLVYLGIVVAFESLLGYFQPRPDATVVITTFDAGQTPHDRVVSRLESDGQLYVAANHWPRAWYHRALEHPEVAVTQDGEKGAYRAVPVPAGSAEHERVARDNALEPGFRFLMGFPPRRFLRLEPR